MKQRCLEFGAVITEPFVYAVTAARTVTAAAAQGQLLSYLRDQRTCTYSRGKITSSSRNMAYFKWMSGIFCFMERRASSKANSKTLQ